MLFSRFILPDVWSQGRDWVSPWTGRSETCLTPRKNQVGASVDKLANLVRQFSVISVISCSNLSRVINKSTNPGYEFLRSIFRGNPDSQKWHGVLILLTRADYNVMNCGQNEASQTVDYFNKFGKES